MSDERIGHRDTAVVVGQKNIDDACAALERVGIAIQAVKDLDHLDSLRGYVDLPDERRPVIIAAGGDGTIGSVAERLVGSRAQLGILPMGTSNDVARSFGVPLDLNAAAGVVKSSTIEQVDVGQFEGPDGTRKCFVHAAAMGINVAFAKLATQPSFRSRMGPFTYAAAALAALRRAKSFDCELTFANTTIRVNLLHLCIINAPVFGGCIGLEITGSKVSDSRLDMLAVTDMSLLRAGIALVPILFGSRRRVHNVNVYQVNRVRIVAPSNVEVSLDGEVRAALPGTFSVAAKSLRVISPRRF